MDRLEVVQIDSANVVFNEELISQFKNIADPFGNQLTEVTYEPNPNDMSNLTKTIGFVSESADGASASM